jgi:hypothetical protein
MMGTNLPIPPRDPDAPVMQYIVIDVDGESPVDWVDGWKDIDPEGNYSWNDRKWLRFRIKPVEIEDADDEPCCEDADELSSHYHCARCHARVSMMGHAICSDSRKPDDERSWKWED